MEYEIGSIQGLTRPNEQDNIVMRENVFSHVFSVPADVNRDKRWVELFLVLSEEDLNVDPVLLGRTEGCTCSSVFISWHLLQGQF